MRKLSKILVLVLALAMMFTLVSMFTASAADEETKTIYFKPPTSGHWHQGNERYAVYSWGGSTGDTWNDLKDFDGDGVYSAEIPAGDTKVIFCRMNKGATTNNWNNKWNQSADYTLGTTDLNTVYFTVANSDSQTCAVSKYSYTPPVNAHVCTPVVIAEESFAATCITSGFKVTKCSDPTCGLRDETVLAPAHTFVSGVCSACGFNTTEGHTVYFKNTDKWSTVNAYYWGETNPVAWPGTAIKESNGLYSVTVPAGSYNVIFNNGSTQTDDLVVPAEPMVYNLATKAWEDLPHVHNYVAGEVVAPTYTADGYTVYTCSCGLTENRDTVAKLVPAFPEAVVTPIPGIVDETTTLTFALNFGIKGVSIVDGELVLDETILTEEYIAAVLETYGRMYVDYRLTISGLNDPSITLNSDGTADGFLGGQYDAWSENWVCVPFGDSVVIENGKSLMIMEYAAELMGQEGLRMILEEIITVVIDFDCGVYFTPEFLEHNPDMVVTLELIVFNENEAGELVDVITVAENVFTVPHTHKYTAVVTAPTCETAGYTTYTCDCGDTYTADEVPAVGHIYFYNVCLTCYAPNPYFEYNFMITGTNTVKVNEYHLVDTAEGGHGFPYQFTTFTVFEDGHYVFSSDKYIGFTIFTIEVNTEGADWTTGTGASWGEFIVGNEVDLKAGTYYVGMIYMSGLGEYQVTIEKAAEECVDHVDADTDYVCDNCGAELERPEDPKPEDPKPEDPTPVDPVDPQPEEKEETAEEKDANFFAKIWEKIVAFLNSILDFFKNIF